MELSLSGTFPVLSLVALSDLVLRGDRLGATPGILFVVDSLDTAMISTKGMGN